MESFSAPERETIVTMNDDSDVVVVWTAQRPVITKLRNNPAFTETRAGTYGTSVWAEFTIPSDRFSLGAKRVVSASTRSKMSERARTSLAPRSA